MNDKRVVTAHPLLDSLGLLLLLLPVLRHLVPLVAPHSAGRVGWAAAALVLVVGFNWFGARPGGGDGKSARRPARPKSLPPAWSWLIRAYLAVRGSAAAGRSHVNNARMRASAPQVRYVGARVVGISLAQPSTYRFFVNGLLWTQLAAFDERRLAVFYSLAENSLYRIHAVEEGSEKVHEFTVCTSLAAGPDPLLARGDDDVDAGGAAPRSRSASLVSHLDEATRRDDKGRDEGTRRVSASAPSAAGEAMSATSASATSASAASAATSAATSAGSATSSSAANAASAASAANTANGHTGSIGSASSTASAASTELSVLDIAPVSAAAPHAAHVTLDEDYIPNPRKRFDVFEESLLSAKNILDFEKGQVRKFRKDSAKKLAALRSEIESTNTKVGSKRRGDERTRKRIQALKERVAQHRAELARLEELELRSSQRAASELVVQAESIERDLKATERGHRTRMRDCQAQLQAQAAEIARREHRCAKLAKSVEKARRDAQTRLKEPSRRVAEYIAEVKAERSTRRARRERLEADFRLAIEKLEYP